jgi:hypothetical protein
MICSALVSSLFGTIVWSFALLSGAGGGAACLAGSLAASAVGAGRAMSARPEFPDGALWAQEVLQRDAGGNSPQREPATVLLKIHAP